MNRSQRTLFAKETVEIIQRGFYDVAGRRVDISGEVKKCLSETKQLTPAELYALRDLALASPRSFSETLLKVVNETTLSGLRRLRDESSQPIAVLNFASAKNAGGGFLNGSEAQEESLARSSALYASQRQAFSFYENHRNSPSCLYSDAMIVSPDCPVIRDDEGELLPVPLKATFVTSPAPNAGALADQRSHELREVSSVLNRRAELVLALAASRGHTRLILGAWGCGVFRNDPAEVARAFADHLHGQWAGRFREVLFSVLDRSAEKRTFAAFQQALS